MPDFRDLNVIEDVVETLDIITERIPPDDLLDGPGGLSHEIENRGYPEQHPGESVDEMLDVTDVNGDGREQEYHACRENRRQRHRCGHQHQELSDEKNAPGFLGRIRLYGSVARGKELRRILEIGRDGCKEEKGYGRRWKVKRAFSDAKRLFGNILRSRTWQADVEEAVAKIVLLNEYKGIRMRCQGSR